MSVRAGSETGATRPAPMVRRPPRRKGRELMLVLAIVLAWVAAGAVATEGRPFDSLSTGEHTVNLAILAALCWLTTEVIGKRGLALWPASTLGILGPVTLGFAAVMATPELRALDGMQKLPVIYGVCSAAMLAYLLRFRLPGLVSPVALSGTLALFIWLTQGDLAAMQAIEGLTPRGILAALLDRPLVVAVFGLLSLGACWLGWHLDRKADYFGVETARPLHIVGGGILALIAGKYALLLLPAWIDFAAIVALFGVLLAWSLRIDRMAVMSAGTVAMTRPLFLAFAEPLGIRFTIIEWSGIYTAMVGVAMIAWLLARRRAVALGWTRKVRNIRWEWSDPAFMSRRAWRELMEERHPTHGA